MKSLKLIVLTLLIANKAFSASPETATTTQDSLKDTINKIVEKAKETGTSLADTLKNAYQATVDYLSGKKDVAADKVTEVKDKTRTAVDETKSNVNEANLASTWQSVKDFFTNAWDKTKSALTPDKTTTPEVKS